MTVRRGLLPRFFEFPDIVGCLQCVNFQHITGCIRSPSHFSCPNMSTSRIATTLLFFALANFILAQQEQQIAVPAAAITDILALDLEPDHGSSEEQLIVSISSNQLAKLEQRGVNYELLSVPSRGGLFTMSQIEWSQRERASATMVPHDAYLSYDLYEERMQAFADSYPEICKLHQLGQLESGRRILALEITDRPEVEEVEPKVFYTSTMHGDELAGYPLMLFLAEELLTSYGQNSELTELVNETEIWINPLANPDGTYAAGNHTVNGSTRRNANGVDLNRNFPDPDDGEHPDGQLHQEETKIFMKFHQLISFDLSCNLHTGAEVFNYPWDTYGQTHPDDAWWRYIGREFADEIHENCNDRHFFRQLNNGITNGYAWYHVSGGRQDYVNYFHRGREATLEIEGQKALSPAELERLWQSSRHSLIGFIQQSGYGLRGVVTDAKTGDPLRAQIRIPGHDELNSEVFSKLPTGRYHRYLKAGTYTFEFSAPGYETQTFTRSIEDDTPTFLDVELKPEAEVR